jgi:hypothetical protein
LVNKEVREALDKGWLKIEHVIFPARPFKESALSRVKTGLEWDSPGASVDKQLAVIYKKTAEEIYQIAKHELKVTFLVFPLLVQDAYYRWEKLSPIFKWKDINKFMEVFGKTMKPDMILFDFSSKNMDAK